MNSMPLSEQQYAYGKYIVPESLRGPVEVLIAKIDFNKPRPPLLFIAGGADHLIPASLNGTNYVRYKKSLSVTDYEEFPGRVHFTIGQRGWEEVADYVISWLKSQNI
jgi:pimeloyl-ACP methyl ester carboxylesterase